MAASAVDFQVDADVALITLDNPPVNALSQAARSGLLSALRAALTDTRVRAIVLRGKGRAFSAGADVTEFGTAPQRPHLPELTEAIERSDKFVVAALHGSALGGGFEIALASHYRIAARDAKVGLPEVRLGLMPGAGGTQRLPRLIGAAQALQWITSGDSVEAARALEAGAIDEIAEGDLAAAALAAARRLVARGGAPRRTGDLAAPPIDDAAWSAVEGAVAKKQRHLLAPRLCADAIRAAVSLPFAQGLQRERQLFLELPASPQAAALRHAFLGEREATKAPGLPEGVASRPIVRVAVIGAGTMGGGIAMAFANAGFPVTLIEADATALDRGRNIIRDNYAASVARGGLAQAEMDRRMERIVPTLSFNDAAGADLIVEAVFEDLEVKRKVFKQLDRIARQGAIFATNTSYLSVTSIAGFTRRPQDVVGMHFFSPANVMRLLENVRTARTAPDVIATVMQIGKSLGKVAVLVGDGDGFVGNRMLAQRTREAYFLLEEGSTPQQIDRVLTDFGFAMGPFAVGDLAGLDIGWRNRNARAHLRKAAVRDCDLLDQVCALGRFGQKTGAGWYRYEKGSRTPIADPAIEQLIVEHSRRSGIERRPISDDEILERCLYSMINEGARILQEGVAARPVDVDMVWLHGYGFPAWRGGPMFHADRVGLAEVHAAILKWKERFGPDFWTPAPMLAELAATGRGFYPRSVTSPEITC
ncbi:MAG: enoyl-CoA hydratase/isomerase family protein [Burkholderiaceae bacterium]|nr:enoyl-CoA hydratase/isomerase family protein [Burkholderiaceae bacterium]